MKAHRRKGPYYDELEEGMKRAISSYEDDVTSGKDAGPFVIHANVPFLAFQHWYKKQESSWRIAFQFTDAEGGAAMLYGDPLFLHEAISQWFMAILVEQAAILVQGPVSSMIQLIRSSRIILPASSHKEPDFAVQPKKSHHKIPPFVGEIAYPNESLPILQGELVQWTIQGGAKIAYGVKVSKQENRTGKSEVQLRFLERKEGEERFTMDFSPKNCTTVGDPKFQVKFPLGVVFGGSTNDQRLLEGVAVFDLYELQQMVLELLEN
ncbi:hypothetical protein L7F22_058137 [Adiantum nelumboides]|nr:hypothetical protein [Adiantum nelumboides]